MPRLFLLALLPVLLVAPSHADDAIGTPESWVEWHRVRAEKLLAEGLIEETIEELFAQASLMPDGVEPLGRAAVLAVEFDHLQGRTLQPRTQMYAIADRAIREAVARGGTGDAAVTYAVGRLRMADQHWGTAWRTLGQALDRGFDPVRGRYWYFQAIVNRSAALIDSMRPQKAMDDLQQLLREQPNHPGAEMARINLAAAHRVLDERAESERLIHEILRTNPNSAPAHRLLGMLYYDEGRNEDALQELRRTAALSKPTAADPMFTDALLRQADALLRLEKLDDAEDVTRRFLVLRKDDPAGMLRMGQVARARGESREAVRWLRRAARRKSDSLSTLVHLKSALTEAGETADAEEVQARIDAVKRSNAVDLLAD